jgi:iron complex outermembrane receptor protein
MISKRASLVLFSTLFPALALAQTNQSPALVLPTVIVTAEKEPADIKDVPASVTAVTAQAIRDSGALAVTETGMFAPNTVFTEFTARKVSNARFRGIGASPANPAITTYIDGVPQLNSNTSNIELIGVNQIEFVRGPQSMLFGRNTLGGIVNVTSTKPNLAKWTGSVMAPFGSTGLFDARGDISGPISDKVAVSLAAGGQRRDGFTLNATTNHNLDSRQGTFVKAQVLFLPTANWEGRLIFANERDRDGDYALGDLSALRLTPFRVLRDYEGFTNRDIQNVTLNLKGTGQNVSIYSTTGVINWKTNDSTDLDYSPLPLATRDNLEKSTQVTQEIRVASPDNAPMQIGSMMLKWQAGFNYFNQGYNQDAVNSFSPFVLSPQVNVPVAMHSPEADIDTIGAGVFGRATLTLADKADVVAGARFDHESADAHLNTYFSPVIAPASVVAQERSFTDVSPEFAFSYRYRQGQSAYASVARGYKAGGFNPAAVPGSETYDEEHAWHVEFGAKTTAMGGKVSANAALFMINWDDLQLNVPNQFVPGQFYISNVGSAHSRGLEFDVAARPHSDVDIFAALGFTSARFGDATRANGVDVSDKRIPYTPDYTASFGAQLRRAVSATINGYGRIDVVLTGQFNYDEANTQAQDAYALANLRAGATFHRYFAEAWMRNAFDTHYIPIAIPYPGFAPSGFIGEYGRPRTFGVTIGVTFD